MNRQRTYVSESGNKSKPRSVEKEERSVEEEKQFFQKLSNDIIGSNEILQTPFGGRKLLYCDYTASGRNLGYIEDYIRQEVMPLYGNTHSSNNYTALQSTYFRQEARENVGKLTNTNRETDVIIFAGSGSTGAIHKLLDIVLLHSTEEEIKNTTIILGPHEHHSSILPWREKGCNVIHIGESENGDMDMNELEMKLKQSNEEKKEEGNGGGSIFGMFSAASNITGVMENVDEITTMCHKYGAYCFWDYATAGPYVKIDFNPGNNNNNNEENDNGEKNDDDGMKLRKKDAIVFSGHKYLGGPQSPGVLLIKRGLFHRNCCTKKWDTSLTGDDGGKLQALEGTYTKNVPSTTPGGGTVFFVTETDHTYVADPGHREEGGTPEIIGTVKKRIHERKIHERKAKRVK